MTPSRHKKICYFAMAAWTFAGVIAGTWLHGWAGVVWAFPGLIVGSILHKLIMENLPVHCPRCGNRVRIQNFQWPGLGGQNIPGDYVDTNAQSATIYRCHHCGFEQVARME